VSSNVAAASYVHVLVGFGYSTLRLILGCANIPIPNGKTHVCVYEQISALRHTVAIEKHGMLVSQHWRMLRLLESASFAPSRKLCWKNGAKK